jgi:lysyl-tRNA synthetase class II
VFEINHSFRNERMDSSDSLESISPEVFQALAGDRTMAALTCDLGLAVAERVPGSTAVHRADRTEFDRAGKWREIFLFGAVRGAR